MIDSFSEVVLASLIYVVVVGRWECGNREAISKSSGKGGKPVVGFPGFPAARHFHGWPASGWLCSFLLSIRSSAEAIRFRAGLQDVSAVSYAIE